MRFRQSVHGELEEVPEEAEDEEAPAEQEQERIVYPARPTPWEERMLRLGTDMAHPHAGTENDNDNEPPEHAGTSGPSNEHPPPAEVFGGVAGDYGRGQMILASMALRSEQPPKHSTYNYDDMFDQP